MCGVLGGERTTVRTLPTAFSDDIQEAPILATIRAEVESERHILTVKIIRSTIEVRVRFQLLFKIGVVAGDYCRQ